MKVVMRTATEARQDFFELLAAARYGGQVTLVTKNGKIAAKIVPENKPLIDWDVVKKVMKVFAGKFNLVDETATKAARMSVGVRDKNW